MIIDVHGAPGSQNGFDNSGHRTDSPSWTQGDTTNQLLSVIGQIAKKYATSGYQDTVVGIELLNEPLPERLAGGTGAVVQFSKDGYGKVREVSDTPVIASDAFQAGAFWNGVLEGDAKNGKITPNSPVCKYRKLPKLTLKTEHKLSLIITNTKSFPATN